MMKVSIRPIHILIIILFIGIILCALYCVPKRSEKKEHLSMIPLVVPGTENTVLTGSPSCVIDTREKRRYAPRGISSMDMSELDMGLQMEEAFTSDLNAAGHPVDAYRPNNKPLNAAMQDEIPPIGMDFRSIPSGPFSDSGISFETKMA